MIPAWLICKFHRSQPVAPSGSSSGRTDTLFRSLSSGTWIPDSVSHSSSRPTCASFRLVRGHGMVHRSRSSSRGNER